MIRLYAAGVIVAALISLAASPTAAQNVRQIQVCVSDREALYNVRATIETFVADTTAGHQILDMNVGRWRIDGRQEMGGRPMCYTYYASEHVKHRVTVEGYTGLEWRLTCRQEFPGHRSIMVLARGTAQIQSCAIQ